MHEPLKCRSGRIRDFDHFDGSAGPCASNHGHGLWGYNGGTMHQPAHVSLCHSDHQPFCSARGTHHQRVSFMTSRVHGSRVKIGGAKPQSLTIDAVQARWRPLAQTVAKQQRTPRAASPHADRRQSSLAMQRRAPWWWLGRTWC